MELKDIKIGILVEDCYHGIGWIKDLSQNAHKELCLIVKWQDGSITTTHHKNIKKWQT